MSEPILSAAWWSSVLVGSLIGSVIWTGAAVAMCYGWAVFRRGRLQP